MNFYESDQAVSEYLLFHYGGDREILPSGIGPLEALQFPVRCVTECLETEALPANARALDLGCAVGRSAFELARHCSEVMGIDFSQRFIDVATHLANQGTLTYSFAVEGELRQPATAAVDPSIERTRVRFEQGDATRLREDLGEFDVVLLANLLCRLPDPRACLARLPGLVRPAGQVIVTTPCTWMEDYTPRNNWLGGFARNGEPVRTLDTLKQILGADFELRRTLDLPMLIREHERKFQWTVTQASVWLKPSG